MANPVTKAIFAGILGCASLFAGAAQACVICVPFPSRTDADLLIESQAAALARENPDKPFSYRIVETLKGVPDNLDVDLFVDSRTRRMLSLYPAQGVILVLTASNEWRSLGFADAEVEAVMRRILHQAPSWKSEATDFGERLAFFAVLLGHDNSRLHRLAYLEVGRAPYSEIKRFSGMWPASQIRELLSDPRYLEWYPLAIMMLAHNGEVSDRDYIIGKFSSLARFGMTTNLSAWTTALIEIQEGEAIAAIEEKYFRSSTRSREELVAVTTALSEHGSNGHTHLRDRIVQSYATLLDYHPEMASYVAKDLMIWRRWELSDRLKKILSTIKNTDPLTTSVIKLYLAQPKKADTSW